MKRKKWYEEMQTSFIWFRRNFITEWISPLPIYIVSNIDTIDVLKAIDFHQLSPTGIFTSEDAKAYKPRKEIFELALKSTGLHADEVIHIGDSLSSDVKGASSVGIKAIWLNRFGKKNSSDVDCITNLLEALHI